jgi:glycosyltransferase involved in cell wall biosynthesis
VRILLLSQFFEPEPVFKGMLFARALVRRGHEVEVLTGFPNYPGGNLYPGYRLRAFSREVMDGIPINRAYLYPSHDRSALKRSANYLSFALTGSLAALTRLRRPDVVYAYHPPASAVVPAIALRLLRGVPYVLDVQDLWPDTIAATGMLSRRLPLAILSGLTNATYRHASHVVVQSEGFRRTLVERGVPEEKLSVIHNWCDDTALLGSAPPSPAGADATLTVLFAGTMGLAQGLESVLTAAALCRDRLPRTRFVFVGGGTERGRLEALARERGLVNVEFLARRPPAEMPELFRQADVLLVHLKDDPLFSITIPSKTQAYLAAGKPILMAVRGDAAAIVERAGAGVTCPPEDPAALVTALERLHAMGPRARAEMGQSGRRFYAQHLSVDAGVDRFVSVFERVVHGTVLRAPA